MLSAYIVFLTIFNRGLILKSSTVLPLNRFSL